MVHFNLMMHRLEDSNNSHLTLTLIQPIGITVSLPSKYLLERMVLAHMIVEVMVAAITTMDGFLADIHHTAHTHLHLKDIMINVGGSVITDNLPQ